MQLAALAALTPRAAACSPAQLLWLLQRVLHLLASLRQPRAAERGVRTRQQLQELVAASWEVVKASDAGQVCISCQLRHLLLEQCFELTFAPSSAALCQRDARLSLLLGALVAHNNLSPGLGTHSCLVRQDNAVKASVSYLYSSSCPVNMGLAGTQTANYVCLWSQTADQGVALHLRAALQALKRERDLLRPADVDLIDIMLRDLESSAALAAPPSPSREPVQDSTEPGMLPS